MTIIDALDGQIFDNKFMSYTWGCTFSVSIVMMPELLIAINVGCQKPFLKSQGPEVPLFAVDLHQPWEGQLLVFFWFPSDF